MIYITGDTHGDVRRFSKESFPEQEDMAKDDFVIILGDFGLVWDKDHESKEEKYWLDWLDNKPFTTLFIDGNHENFDRLYEYPVEFWNGGLIHKIRPSVFHLMRGEVFDLCGKKFFCMGGAESHDISDGILEPDQKDLIKHFKKKGKSFRINHASWWDRELPDKHEILRGTMRLLCNDFKVDFILTHSPSSSEIKIMSDGGCLYGENTLTNTIDLILNKTEHKKHLFGHMHADKQLDEKSICLYEQIIRIV